MPTDSTNAILEQVAKLLVKRKMTSHQVQVQAATPAAGNTWNIISTSDISPKTGKHLVGVTRKPTGNQTYMKQK